MVRRITETHARRHPRAQLLDFTEGTDEERTTLHQEELFKDLERIIENLRRSVKELDRSVPFDVRDRVTVKSNGVGVRIQVPHKLPHPPTDYLIINQTGSGDLWQDGDTLADSVDMFFRSSAQANVAFKVVPFSTESIRGRGSREAVVIDQDQRVTADEFADVGPPAQPNDKPPTGF